jgi:cell division protease FtsH
MWSKSEFEAAIATALGGHVVEEMLYGEVTTGPSSDLQRASEVARRMVTEFGMSKEIGPLVFAARKLWGEGPDYRGFGEYAARRIEAEVWRVVRRAHQRAFEIVDANRDVLFQSAKVLLERETLGAADLERLFASVQSFQTDRRVEAPRPERAEPRRLVPAPWRRRRRDSPSAALLASQLIRRDS